MGMRGEMAGTKQHVVFTDQEYKRKPARLAGKASAVQLVGTADEEEHRRPFLPPAWEARNRPARQQRELQRCVRSLALQHGRPTDGAAGVDFINPYTEPNIPPNRKARVGPVITGI